MSKFNDYARRLDTLARENFQKYTNAEEEYKRTRSAADMFPKKSITSAEYEAKRARAIADFKEAEQAFKNVREEYAATLNEVAQIRTELVNAIEEDHIVDPAQLDNATVELLKSGILKPADYVKIMDEAKNSGNHTMIRLITKYAEDASKALENSGMEQRKYLESRACLNNVITAGRTDDGREYLEAFDFLADAYRRSVNNPAMIPYWDKLTAYAVENL